MPEENANELVTRQERREERLGKKKEKMPQKEHSAYLQRGAGKACGSARREEGQVQQSRCEAGVGARFTRGFRANSGSTIPLGVAI
jgi:hypothetical protein